MNLYTFYYPDLNIKQIKVLIHHSIYETYKRMPYDTKDEILAAKNYLNSITNGNEWFTNRSPFYYAIKSGKVIVNGGSYNCIVTKN